MKTRFALLSFALAFAFAFGALAQAQVATAEVLGVETTSAPSTGVDAWLEDGSVGEVQVTVRALDANGNPVAGAPVQWRVDNLGSMIVYVVGSSAGVPGAPLSVYTAVDTHVDGGVTDANGEAFLLVDSMFSGDARVFVTVGGVDGKTYRGRDMRIVWF